MPGIHQIRRVVLNSGRDEAPFTLESLGLDFYVRAFPNPTNYSYWGIRSTVTSGIFDQSKLLAPFSTVHTCTFATDAHSWTNLTNLTVDGNIDGIFGKDNCLRLTGNTTVGSHHTWKATGTVNDVFRIRGMALIPSTNSVVDGIEIGHANGVFGQHIVSGSFDTWIPFDFYITITTLDRNMIRLLDGAVASFNSGTDVVYISEYSVDKISGSHLRNTSTLTAPNYNTTNKCWDWNGTDEYVDDVNHTDVLTTLRRLDSTGAFAIPYFDYEGTGNLMEFFNFSDLGTGNRFVPYIDTDDHLKLVTRAGGISITNDFGAVSRSAAMHRVYICTNSAGTSYNVYFDGTLLYQGGNGDWLAESGGVNLTQFRIGINFNSTAYFNIGERGILYAVDPTKISSNIANIEADELFIE